MKKKIAIVLVIAAVLVIPISVFAAASGAPAAKNIRGFFGIDTSKFTDEQKADLNEYKQKMADLQKDYINKMVENGTMTAEQGSIAIKKIDESLENGTINSFMPGLGMGKGGMGRFERKDKSGIGAIDTSKLTEEQKTDLLNSYKSVTALQKEFINKMVANSLLTSTQGETAIKKIDQMDKALQENGLLKGLGILKGRLAGFDCFGMNRIDTAQLTEQQKTDLADYTSKMDAARKEIISKLVSYEVITAEQGEALLSKTDLLNKTGIIQKFHEKKGLFKGMGRSL